MNDLEKMLDILDDLDISYNYGAYYKGSDKINGYWIEINAEIDFNKEGERV